MSQLAPFVRAFRALSKALRKRSDLAQSRSDELDTIGDPTSGEPATAALVLVGISAALEEAATDLEQQIARDLGRPGAGRE